MKLKSAVATLALFALAIPSFVFAAYVPANNVSLDTMAAALDTMRSIATDTMSLDTMGVSTDTMALDTMAVSTDTMRLDTMALDTMEKTDTMRTDTMALDTMEKTDTMHSISTDTMALDTMGR